MSIHREQRNVHRRRHCSLLLLVAGKQTGQEGTHAAVGAASSSWQPTVIFLITHDVPSLLRPQHIVFPSTVILQRSGFSRPLSYVCTLIEDAFHIRLFRSSAGLRTQQTIALLTPVRFHKTLVTVVLSTRGPPFQNVDSHP